MTAPRQTILVVDDDHTVRSSSAELLRKNGYKVLEAGSGTEALAALRDYEGPIDLLLTDVQMQKMDGGELAEAAEQERPGIHILFMSGYTSGAALHDNVRDDGVDFIAKPFVLTTLLRKVKSILG
jgi:CheY-like chemotaxis protein